MGRDPRGNGSLSGDERSYELFEGWGGCHGDGTGVDGSGLRGVKAGLRGQDAGASGGLRRHRTGHENEPDGSVATPRVQRVFTARMRIPHATGLSF